MKTAVSPCVYVGTYAKYNSGSIAGDWVELTDKDEFYERIRELHSDEAYPEFMFQDTEGIPDAFVGESSIDDRAWQWAELDEHEREIWSAALSVDRDAKFDDAQKRFAGFYDSAESWAEEFLTDTGSLKSIPENFRRYFDFESYARACELNGEIEFIECDRGVAVFSRR